MTMRTRRLLAAPTMGERGGGVGQVSALLFDAMRDTWPRGVDLVTLGPSRGGAPRVVDKLRFGGAVAARRLTGRSAWTLFAHAGLARVEARLPPALRSPYAVYLHGVEAWRPLDDADRRALAGASVRLANSAFTARRVAAANPGVGEIVICPPSLAKGAEPASETLARAGSMQTVLVVGRLDAGERYKGHEQLIRAWRAIVARAPAATLVIVGDGTDAARLRSLAAASGASGSIRFTGFLSRADLNDAYRSAALFALPSRAEGFGLVYLEAMAHGLACVGSRHDAAAEVIADDVSGVLVDPGDDEAMARTIVDLLRSPERRRRMGEAGRARVAAAYRYAQFRDRIADVLRQAFHDVGEAA